ncbi:MAG: hypothetical protein LBN43_02155, partial [Oscillospiraceae bacterium]|nr:hypothetical protein [Oscillospiraceae bacterium]
MTIIGAVYFVSIIILFIVANYFNAHQLGASFTIIVVGDILWPLTFFLTGGLDSAMAPWFVLSIFICFFYARGSKLVLYICLHFSMIIACYLVAAMHPELVYSLTPTQRFSEHLMA